MAFSREQSVQPQSIGDIRITLFDPDPTENGSRSATVHVQIFMSDGHTRIREFDLVQHVSAQTINQLIAFVDSIRTKANNEILPQP